MFDIRDALSPPQRLAVVYARPDVREAFSVLLAFDAKMRAIVATTSEPLIGQLKLAWWRDAIMADHGRRPRGEPLFTWIDALGANTVRTELLLLLDAWEILLVEEGTDAALARSASDRSAGIFGGYQRLVGCDADLDELGTAWAISDLTGNGREQNFKGILLPPDRLLRPLTILARSASGASGPRLIWHALTGR